MKTQQLAYQTLRSLTCNANFVIPIPVHHSNPRIVTRPLITAAWLTRSIFAMFSHCALWCKYHLPRTWLADVYHTTRRITLDWYVHHITFNLPLFVFWSSPKDPWTRRHSLRRIIHIKVRWYDTVSLTKKRFSSTNHIPQLRKGPQTERSHPYTLFDRCYLAYKLINLCNLTTTNSQTDTYHHKTNSIHSGTKDVNLFVPWSHGRR